MPHKCLITGISGQTGAFLAAHLLSEGHSVEGTSRTHAPDLWRLKHFGIADQVKIHALNASETQEITHIAARGYDRIFHLAAESSVAASLKDPAGTVRANILQTTSWLAGIRDHSPQTRFFNAASSEIFKPSEQPLTEDSPKQATNPYAVTKLAAANMAQVFRDSFDMFIVNGILFNHESELRDNRFVTAKIVNSVRALSQNTDEPAVQLGNIAAQRDFSYAGDFARGIKAALDHHVPQDYIFASGQLHSIKQFFDAAARYFGFDPQWSGTGLDAVCTDKASERTLATISEKFFRPIDEAGKSGHAQKAKDVLGWRPEYDFESIIHHMAKFGGTQQV